MDAGSTLQTTHLLDAGKVSTFYADYAAAVGRARSLLGRPLTYTEKILYAHMRSPLEKAIRGETDVALNVDRVAMQDATAQMALLQFMLTERDHVAVPTTVHCDHLIRASKGAMEDLAAAKHEHGEVYAFLKSCANKYGMGFWEPGSGIIHQVVLENYAMPGALMIGTDSHTPNMGGLGMVAIGVGGADAVDAMAGEEWKVQMPKILGVKLTGKLNGWTAPKDIILKVAETLTVKGGTGYILEYFGPGTESISATGKGTITNMGAEIGATTSVFPYDDYVAEYLSATRREFVADEADAVRAELRPDQEVLDHPSKYYDEVIEIDLDTLEPHIVGPFTPDLARPVSKMGADAKANGWPVQLKYSLIGSCTNSSYEDMQRAAAIARQAAAAGLKAKCGFMITPGSEQIYQTIKRDGLIETFEQIGGVVLANACGPCIGQWNRIDVGQGDENSILSSYNRNFAKRNDGNPSTHAFIGSPEIVMAYALAGTLDFNPLSDEIDGVRLQAPPQVQALPEQGFVFNISGYRAPTGEGSVMINPGSERLAPLALFTKDDNYTDMPVLVKAGGKLTTDHISPAGPWLRFRGHLDRISDNLLTGAMNAFTGEAGTGRNQRTGATDELSRIARDYKEHDISWVIVGDSNYGEGSSREHAAMEPRYLGCNVVLANSFARIAETNLKRQGILPLWFANEHDYTSIREDDRISVPDLDVQVGKPVRVVLTHKDGTTDTLETTHTFSEEQIRWFNAGSWLNFLRTRRSA